MAVTHMSQFLTRCLSFPCLQRAGQWQEGIWVSLGVSQALESSEKGIIVTPSSTSWLGWTQRALAIPSGSDPGLAGSWLLPSTGGEDQRVFWDLRGSGALKKKGNKN